MTVDMVHPKVLLSQQRLDGLKDSSQKAVLCRGLRGSKLSTGEVSRRDWIKAEDSGNVRVDGKPPQSCPDKRFSLCNICSSVVHSSVPWGVPLIADRLWGPSQEGQFAWTALFIWLTYNRKGPGIRVTKLINKLNVMVAVSWVWRSINKDQ